MKTLNFLLAATAISIALVSCQKENIEPQKPATDSHNLKPALIEKAESTSGVATTRVSVRYEVSINLILSKPLCNTYQVEVVNEYGAAVATPIHYDPAKSTYIFNEQTNEKSGLRTARLVLVDWPDHYICPTELFTNPSSQKVFFSEGGFISFELYPTVKQGGERVINKD